MLKCKIVAGSANNQLECNDDGIELFRKGIVYAPDYAINAGGLINVAAELDGYNKESVVAKVTKVYDTILDVLETSKNKAIPPHVAADALAEQKLAAKKSVDRAFAPV